MNFHRSFMTTSCQNERDFDPKPATPEITYSLTPAWSTCRAVHPETGEPHAWLVIRAADNATVEAFGTDKTGRRGIWDGPALVCPHGHDVR